MCTYSIDLSFATAFSTMSFVFFRHTSMTNKYMIIYLIAYGFVELDF